MNKSQTSALSPKFSPREVPLGKYEFLFYAIKALEKLILADQKC